MKKSKRVNLSTGEAHIDWGIGPRLLTLVMRVAVQADRQVVRDLYDAGKEKEFSDSVLAVMGGLLSTLTENERFRKDMQRPADPDYTPLMLSDKDAIVRMMTLTGNAILRSQPVAEDFKFLVEGATKMVETGNAGAIAELVYQGRKFTAEEIAIASLLLQVFAYVAEKQITDPIGALLSALSLQFETSQEVQSQSQPDYDLQTKH